MSKTSPRLLSILVQLAPLITQAIADLRAASQDGKISAAEVLAALTPLLEKLPELLGLEVV